jgi:NADH-quinone oxidoreductase subunit L
VAAAGLTAYYITRLMALAFLAQKRYEIRAHESPPLMTIPMSALAALTLAGGWLGSKYLLPFLDPAAGYALESANPEAHRAMMVSVAAALAGIASGFFFTTPVLADALAFKFRAAREVIYNKFYVDEIYAFALTKPLKWLADRVCFGFVDAALIDGFIVNGTAGFLYRAGVFLRRLQTGNAQTYALTFTAGLIMLLYWIICNL